MFGLTETTTKILIGLALVVVIGLGLGWAYKTVEAAGYARAQNEITKKISEENTHAGRNAETWRDKLRACNRDNGVYDFETGTCGS